jgi:acetylornithine deacetylase/succinyl-diaminopimelate desuccinylase-like protein
MNSGHQKRLPGLLRSLVILVLEGAFAGGQLPLASMRPVAYSMVGYSMVGYAHGAARSGTPRGTDLREQVRAYRVANEKQIIADFTRFLQIPNLASDSTNIRRNAEAIAAMMKARQIDTSLLEVPGAPPVVFGELNTPDAKSTVTFYAHYDGQPVDPAQWQSSPWNPVLRPAGPGGSEAGIDPVSAPAPLDPESRIYARSASDDKAPIICFMAGLDALRAAHIQLSVNLRFFLEGEEEAGSPHLQAILDKYSERLRTDAWILCDGPVHQSHRMQVYFGARGTTDLEMTVYGPNRGLHSGHYGNWAPNPIVLLTHLLDTMRDADGRILIPGFYDDVRPLTAQERRALSEMPNVDEDLKKELGLAWTEGGDTPLAEEILKPALNVRGILGGHVGRQAANVISGEASASIDFRLVPDQTLERLRRLVDDHIAKQGFFIVRDTPDAAVRIGHPRIIKLQWGAGYPAARTPMDLPASRAVVEVIERTIGQPIVKMPGLGGSIPMYLFAGRTGRTPVIGVPIANYDNNQHSANENIRLQNLWDGIEIFAGLFAGLGPSLAPAPVH